MRHNQRGNRTDGMRDQSKTNSFPSAHAIARRRVISLLTGLPFLMLAHDAAFGEELSMRAFRAEVLDILRRRFPDKSVTEGAEEATIKYVSPNVAEIDLGNLFASVDDLPRREREEAIVEYFARAFKFAGGQTDNTETATNWERAKPLMRARLFPVRYLKKTPSLLHRDFSRDVIIGYSVDHGTSDGFVADEHAKNWGVTIDTIHPIAIANLEKLSTDAPIEPERPPAGAGYFTVVEQRDGYDAARLLLPEFRARVIRKLGDFVYAGIPARDFLVLWSKDLAAHASFVANIKREFESNPYALSDEIFVITAAGARPATSEETTRSR
jgi:uncharacterized protein YtpQ (UPF0354 family)